MSSRHPAEADSDLEEFYRLVGEATSVRVVEGHTAAGKRNDRSILLLEKSPVAIAELFEAVRIHPLGAHYSIMTRGNPTLALTSADGVLVEINCLGDDMIRSNALSEDGILVVPGSLQRWIARWIQPR